ncbi:MULTISPECIES: thioredoxin family protein [Rhodomicrobium]|uniref:thioredoxin family protein n=1 Tax=Rhodomicrobium TaxID=1068 RepID=UPI000B4BC104|nr:MULTISPECIES: thioredoxin family protein [Rhodomicrobium]
MKTFVPASSLVRAAAALCWLLALITFAAPVSAGELLVVSRPDCVYCKAWEMEVGAFYPKTDVGKIAPLRRIAIEKLAATPYAFKEPVTATPTFVLMDGTMEVGRIIGYSDRADFWQSLKALLNHADPEASPALRKAEAAGGRAGG